MLNETVAIGKSVTRKDIKDKVAGKVMPRFPTKCGEPRGDGCGEIRVKKSCVIVSSWKRKWSDPYRG